MATITRQACPYVQASLQLVMQREEIALSATTANPAQGIAPQQHSANFRFEIGENDGLYTVQVFGEKTKKFHHPDQLSEHIVKLLFYIPD